MAEATIKEAPANVVDKKVLNALITGTFLGWEDHGIPTCVLMLSLEGGGSQGFGNYDLRHYGFQMIERIMRTVDVGSWEQLRGKYCRVEVSGGIIRGIGHLLEEEWYRPEEGVSNG